MTYYDTTLKQIRTESRLHVLRRQFPRVTLERQGDRYVIKVARGLWSSDPRAYGAQATGDTAAAAIDRMYFHTIGKDQL